MEAKNVNFIGALALYQHRRDTAIGLLHVTTRQRGLLWYYRVLQQKLIARVTKATEAKVVMDLIDNRMTQIMTEAQDAPLERKKELLKEALKLKKQAQRVVNG